MGKVSLLRRVLQQWSDVLDSLLGETAEIGQVPVWDGSRWVPVAAPEDRVLLEYLFDTGTTAPPDNQSFSMNAGNYAATTLIWFDLQDLTGGPVLDGFLSLVAGQFFSLLQTTDSDRRVRYELTAAPTLVGGYIECAVVWESDGGQFIQNNASVFVYLPSAAGTGTDHHALSQLAWDLCGHTPSTDTETITKLGGTPSPARTGRRAWRSMSRATSSRTSWPPT